MEEIIIPSISDNRCDIIANDKGSYLYGEKMRILYLPNEYSQQRQFEKKANIYPIKMAMEAEWYRKNGHSVSWGSGVGKYDKVISKPEELPFLSLPSPDRNFTRWQDYQNNGNFKYRPGTYILSANGCWHGKCSFCVEKDVPYEVRPVESVIEEIQECQRLGFREVFDDSGSFPTGLWQHRFCALMIAKRIKMTLGCNMRMVDNDYELMKDAGFRMVLFGLESENQYTLDRVNKGVKVEDVKWIIKAAKAKLEPHIAVMFGFPWETDQDAIRTLKMVWWLLRKGFAKTVQASFYTKEGVESNSGHRKYVRQIYNVAWSPEFWFNQLKDIRNADDIKYLWRKIKAGMGIQNDTKRNF